MNENKADKDDPRVQRAGFKREHNTKDFAHGMYHGADRLDTDHFHDKLVAKHGGSSGQLGNFAIPKKNLKDFHKAAKDAGYNHGEHYDLGDSQHTEESEQFGEVPYNVRASKHHKRLKKQGLRFSGTSNGGFTAHYRSAGGREAKIEFNHANDTHGTLYKKNKSSQHSEEGDEWERIDTYLEELMDGGKPAYGHGGW